VELEAGLRLSKITGLADDLAIALRVPSVRIVAPIPGKNTVGIEVPNEHRQLVRIREVIEETNGRAKRMKIPIYLGKDVAGKSMAVDLASLPHLLIAGRTGTGKSVCLNSIIVSIIMSRGPDEVRMLMIDPKMVELSGYKRLPHLMHPVVTDMRKAEAILSWAVDKMEERYALLARAGVRHVTVYNQLSEEELRERIEPTSELEWENIPRNLPFIVIVADEIADLMMTSGKEVEQHIIRLAQKSRAVGIHLILATQKPTVDVITGLIKSNLPARIAFQVASRTDSRVVLDEMGADKLLGNGDMLFLSPGTSQLLRGQGTFLSDDEITRVTEFVATDSPQFARELIELKTKDEQEVAVPGALKNRDELYEAAVDIVVRERRGSVSLLQRCLGIGYGRAARLIDYMAEDKIVGEYNGAQAREVMISIEDWEAMSGNNGSAAANPTVALPALPPMTAANVQPRPKRITTIVPEDDSEEVGEEAAEADETDVDERETDSDDEWVDDETDGDDVEEAESENELWDEDGDADSEWEEEDEDEKPDDAGGKRAASA
jgi:S-DNA-T family DNA segregation ATPase FtsK/SpoIIIE